MKTIFIILNIALTSSITFAGENASLDTNATTVLAAHGFQYVTLSETQQKVLDATIDRLALEKQTKAQTRSIDQAVVYLWKTINIAVIQTPRACAEYKGYFWFSRLDTAGPDDQTFRSGFAVKKGTGDIYRWDEPKPQPTAAASLSRQEAIRIADEASRKAMRIPIEVQPVVEETADAFVVTYPMTLSKKQMRAPDYYTKVTVDKKMGKITDFKVGS